jgi:hypothetical protein
MLTILVFFVLEDFLYCYFLVCLLVSAEVHNSKCALSCDPLEFVSTLPLNWLFRGRNLFLWGILFLLPFQKNLVGLCFQLFDRICLFRRNYLEILALGNWLLDSITWILIVLRINVKELRLWWGPHCFFYLWFVKLWVRVIIDFSINSAMYFFMGKVVRDLFRDQRLLNSHLLY